MNPLPHLPDHLVFPIMDYNRQGFLLPLPEAQEHLEAVRDLQSSTDDVGKLISRLPRIHPATPGYAGAVSALVDRMRTIEPQHRRIMFLRLLNVVGKSPLGLARMSAALRELPETDRGVALDAWMASVKALPAGDKVRAWRAADHPALARTAMERWSPSSTGNGNAAFLEVVMEALACWRSNETEREDRAVFSALFGQLDRLPERDARALLERMCSTVRNWTLPQKHEEDNLADIADILDQFAEWDPSFPQWESLLHLYPGLESQEEFLRSYRNVLLTSEAVSDAAGARCIKALLNGSSLMSQVTDIVLFASQQSLAARRVIFAGLEDVLGAFDEQPGQREYLLEQIGRLRSDLPLDDAECAALRDTLEALWTFTGEADIPSQAPDHSDPVLPLEAGIDAYYLPEDDGLDASFAFDGEERAALDDLHSLLGRKTNRDGDESDHHPTPSAVSSSIPSSVYRDFN